MLVIAHRGASGQFPENTLQAFDNAVLQKADGIELDITLSEDGQFVVLHDDTLDRTTTGTGVVGFQTVAEMQCYDAGSWKSPEHSNQRVPLISQVIQRYQGQIELNIEIKPFFPVTSADLFETAVEHLLDEITRLEMRDSVLISSVNFYILDLVRRYDANIRLALVYQKSITDYDPRYVHQRLGLWSIHPYYRQITADFVSGCTEAGIKVIPFTINRLDQWEKVKDLGVAGLITNWPSKAQQWITSQATTG